MKYKKDVVVLTDVYLIIEARPSVLSEVIEVISDRQESPAKRNAKNGTPRRGLLNLFANFVRDI